MFPQLITHTAINIIMIIMYKYHHKQLLLISYQERRREKIDITELKIIKPHPIYTGMVNSNSCSKINTVNMGLYYVLTQLTDVTTVTPTAKAVR